MNFIVNNNGYRRPKCLIFLLLPRLERIEAAEKYLKAGCLEKDYVFIPINRRYIQN